MRFYSLILIWSRILFGQLMVTQLLKVDCACYGT
jgi:hypothetical protein